MPLKISSKGRMRQERKNVVSEEHHGQKYGSLVSKEFHGQKDFEGIIEKPYRIYEVFDEFNKTCLF